MAAIRRIQGRIQAATQIARYDVMFCWIAGAFLAAAVMGRSVGIA